jgi:predicted dehydrogenase
MASVKRLGLVGAGAIGQTYLAVIRAHPEIELVGIADQRFETATAAAESSRCPAFHTVSELIDAATPHGIIVCTPPASHFTISHTALAAGVAVLCEKPLCLRMEEARGLRALAEENKVVFTMASKFRYVEDVIRAKAIISSGILGKVILVENVFTTRVQMNHRWNSEPSISGGGVIIDNGTHSVDIVRFLLDPVDAVFALEGNRLQADKVEDSATLMLRTAAGIDARIELSWSYQKPDEFFVTVFGMRGILQVGWSRSRYKRHEDGAFTQFGNGYDKLAAFKAQISNFCAAIDGNERLLIDAADAVASVEVIDAAYASLRSGRREKVQGHGGEPSHQDVGLAR